VSNNLDWALQSISVLSVQGSAQPLAAEAASLIEKETLAFWSW
jgi:hypothetical protein